MSEDATSDLPFQTLGNHLRYLREQSKESTAEVSGAVEIDEPALSRIEAGFERPPEDILLLLINHFGMQNQEAVQLWELAGYDGDIPDQLYPQEEAQTITKNVVMLLALDMRTVYTDDLDIAIGQTGMILNFSQTSGQDQRVPVARLGMSYEQAESVMKNLQQALLKAKYLHGPKTLPPTNQSPSSSDREDLK